MIIQSSLTNISFYASEQKFNIKFLVATVVLAISMVCSPHGVQAAESSKDFVTDASIGNEFEVKSSEVALQKSQNDEIKKFAHHMINDHSKAEDDLKTAVSAAPDSDVQMPTSKLDPKHTHMLRKLNDANGDDFDKLYVKYQVKAHKNAVSLFKDYSKNGDNDTLKAFAANTLPTLQAHLQDIDSIDSSQ